MKRHTLFFVIATAIAALASCEKKIDQISISGTENGHNYVDLGTSVYWAVANVGTTEPQSVGNRYAWGETETKSQYTVENYTFSDSIDEGFMVSTSKYNKEDNLTTLLPEDDAATHNMGGKWRTPTVEEWQELRDLCYGYFATYQGVKGYLVVGANGNNMFLPFTSYPQKKHNNRTGIYMTGNFYPNHAYWFTSIIFGYRYDIQGTYANDKEHYYQFFEKEQFRYNGFQIRAVCDKTAPNE